MNAAKDRGLDVPVEDAVTLLVGEEVPLMAVVVVNKWRLGAKPTWQICMTMVWLGKAAIIPGTMDDIKPSRVTFGEDWIGTTVGIRRSATGVPSKLLGP